MMLFSHWLFWLKNCGFSTVLRAEVVFYLESRFLGCGEKCRKHWRKEEIKQKKNIEKWRERKTKNTRKVQLQQYTSLVLSYILLENIVWRKVVYTFIPWNFIYSFYVLQDIWNIVMIHESSIYINIQIII